MTPLGRSLHVPRGLDGRPLSHDQEADTFAVVTTAAGRSLRADGGVFPDLIVEDDTLTTGEQTLLIESARAGVPITLRIAEFSFEEARKALDDAIRGYIAAVSNFVPENVVEEVVEA